MRAMSPILLAGFAALLGFAFAATSTHDFVQHLDRQVHGLHCSFLPGVGDTDVSGESGCHVTLMSPYSSVARESVWGGIPISLPAMATFAFLFALAAVTLLTRNARDRRVALFALAAWTVPLLASLVMGYIAFSTLDAACKLCIGIYGASALGFAAAALGVWATRRKVPAAADDTLRDPVHDTIDETAGTFVGRAVTPGLPLGWLVGVALAFQAVPLVVYAAAAPDYSSYVGSCGTLPDASDPHEVLVPVGPQAREVPMLEILDPLCPACRGFEERLMASDVPAQTSRRLLLFPLDDTCNWMVDRAIHPGACAISEAVLCAEGEAEEVLAWAFEEQDALVAAARDDPEAARQRARQRFPALADCIGSPGVQARLNQSLRWAVKNQLPVLTPQVYVGGLRLCDADTDLGMGYALPRLVERYRRDPEAAAAPQAQGAPEPERAPARPGREAAREVPPRAEPPRAAPGRRTGSPGSAGRIGHRAHR